MRYVIFEVRSKAMCSIKHIVGLGQDSGNSIANALELPKSYTKPLVMSIQPLSSAALNPGPLTHDIFGSDDRHGELLGRGVIEKREEDLTGRPLRFLHVFVL